MNQYKTLKQINENPIYAPLGHEEAFKRRIFLDNFERCMNIREFQKTAGIIIKKKITGIHPAAKCMAAPIKEWKENFEPHHYYKQFSKFMLKEFYTHHGADRYKIWACGSGTYQRDTYSLPKHFFENNTGIVSPRIKRFKQVKEYWHSIKTAYYNDDFIRYGYAKYLDHFTAWIKNGERSKKGFMFKGGWSNPCKITDKEYLQHKDFLNLIKN